MAKTKLDYPKVQVLYTRPRYVVIAGPILLKAEAESIARKVRSCLRSRPDAKLLKGKR